MDQFIVLHCKCFFFFYFNTTLYYLSPVQINGFESNGFAPNKIQVMLYTIFGFI